MQKQGNLLPHFNGLPHYSILTYYVISQFINKELERVPGDTEGSIPFIFRVSACQVEPATCSGVASAKLFFPLWNGRLPMLEELT